jgi:hypothetical protein
MQTTSRCLSNLTHEDTNFRAETIFLDEAENSSFLGSNLERLIDFRRSVAFCTAELTERRNEHATA